MEYLMAKEPGPKLEYQNLRPALTALRGFLMVSPNGQKLMAFYKQLLQLQGRWAMAAAEMLAFDTYIKMVHVLFVDRDDPTLVAHMTKVVPIAAYKIAANSIPTRAHFDQILQAEKDRLHQATRAAAERLFDFKVSKDFWNQHGKLVTAIEHCEKKLKELREKTVRRKCEREEARRLAYERNEAMRHRQMGMAGMTPHSAQVERAVVQWVRESKEDYFSFNDPIY
jgi:hypothetical protein